jgi:hypothetical protein
LPVHRAQAFSDDPKFDDSDEAKAVDNRILALTRAITDTPAQGAKGVAIKIYLATHMNGLMRCIDAAALSADVWQDTDFEGHEDARLERAILKDAVRFVPELAPLSANAIKGAPVVRSDERDSEKRLAETFRKIHERRTEAEEAVDRPVNEGGDDAAPEILGFGEPEGAPHER